MDKSEEKTLRKPLEEGQCPVCKNKNSLVAKKDKTPQGWPQEVDECKDCGTRLLRNDPKADHLAAKKAKAEK